MMAPSPRPKRPTPPGGGPTFTTALRFELVDEEQRALLGSYAIASALGLAFLMLVQFGPRMPVVIPMEQRLVDRIVVGDLKGAPDPTSVARTNDRGRGRPREGSGADARATGDIANAFRLGGQIVGQPHDILGAVAITPAGGKDAGVGGKTVLEHGEGGVGSTTPERGGISGGGGGAIGGVRGGGSVARARSDVSNLPVIPVEPLPVLSDASAMGTFVRGHEAQLRFCYQESGLAVNPQLAGSITVAITVAASGSVSNADVTRRSWSGAGSAESEACILRAIRGWRLPTPGSAPATYSFPFNFSR